MTIFNELADSIRGKKLKIVFPEGTDSRILGAALRHQQDGLIQPILIGKREEIQKAAEEMGKSLGDIEIIDPDQYADYEYMVDVFVERRHGKASKEDGEKKLKDHNYFGTMLVYMGLADGLVSGAVGSTADTIRPGLQIIKTKPGVSLVSGAMLMVEPEGSGRLLFSDIAVTIDPDAKQLAEIAHSSAETARIFGIDPRVAMLSFSTKGSSSSPSQEKVAEASQIAKEKWPDLILDGEIQFDAAFVPAVGKKKAPDSPLEGRANVFIFPDLDAGNIGYKIAQRMGGYQAVGPILQGMDKPINDLSRGCSEQDAYNLALITAALV